jgi:hypothetical protein
MRFLKLTLLAGILPAIGVALMLPGLPTRAASHSDAPLIKLDPQANITDVYAFVGGKYNNPSQRMLNVIVHVRPFSEPGDGVMYDRFSDDAVYNIHLANPRTGEEITRYEFRFSSVTSGYKNLKTILSYGLGTEAGPIQSVGDARQNYTQTYSVAQVTRGWRNLLRNGLLTPPPNVGQRTTPAYNDATGKAVSGATNLAGLDNYTRETIYNLPLGLVSFAGPREDGFYADTPGIFDLLDPRILGSSLGQAGNGVDGFKGYNVLAFGIQIPIESVPNFPYNAALMGSRKGIGVYASVSRPRVTLRRSEGEPISAGDLIQVNRMGNPLFNEVLVALKDKDKYNRTEPEHDAQFATYAQNPELAFLINFVFGTNFATSGRKDLQDVFIPDVLRVQTDTPAVRLAGESGFNRLGFIGGDTVSGASGANSSGWPNGRRFGDDVIDVALTAIASGPTYSTVTVVGDNAAANDQVYNAVFPYSATPHAGPRNSKDSGPNN